MLCSAWTELGHSVTAMDSEGEVVNACAAIIPHSGLEERRRVWREDLKSLIIFHSEFIYFSIESALRNFAAEKFARKYFRRGNFLMFTFFFTF